MATALSPADHLSEGLYGVGLVLAGSHDDGLARARRALVLNSNSVTVLGPCGNVLTFCGDATGANDLLERMLRLAPAHYFRSVFLARMALNWLQQGEPKRALALVGEALKLKPEAICNHLTHARLMAAVGQDKAADMAICAGLRLRPDIDQRLIRAMFPYRDQSISEWLTSAVRRLAKA